MKICIIGAGPAGSFAAYNLAKHFDVEIFEKHPQIGRPVQCSGLVTSTIKKIDNIFQSVDFEKVIDTRIKKTRLFSEKVKCEIKLKEPDMVLDRRKFDKWLAKLAENEGAKISTGSEFLKVKREREKKGLLVFINKKNKIEKMRADVLIGADGFYSSVAKTIGNSRDFIPCVQANISYKSNPECMDIFFSTEYKDLFAWIVPKSSRIAEIGLGCREKPSEKFKDFLKKRNIRGKILSHTGGPISLYNKAFKIEDRGIFLVGEAATFVKATTLGGIIPSLKSAKALSNSIIGGEDYEQNIKDLRREMQLHFMARKILDNFSDGDYNLLLKLCKNKGVEEILAKHSRDEYSNIRFLFYLFLARPLLAKFLFKAFV